jgi:dynein heavy chain 1
MINLLQVSDFGDKVEDSTFLNALQNQVSKWIREIQKVTKLDRDPSSGTALQVNEKRVIRGQ